MPLPKITVKFFKDGRQVARFRDQQGLVRTSVGMSSGTIATQGYGAWRNKWTRAEQVRALAEYGIQLQKEQAAAGVGSDGSPMPPLKQAKAKFAGRVNGKATFMHKTLRNLWGTGKQGGHMLDFIRINYLDDQKATYAITSKVQRDKARGNERKAAWWGWSPASMRKMQQKSAELFGTGPAERLFELGIIGASALAFARARTLRRAA